jgi:hypothetical protein
MDSATPSPDDAIPDICVVGAGPLGIALALAARAKGLSVVLLESGSEQPSPEKADLSEAELVDPRRHAGMDVAVCRALGGTSRWWGGRCVPYDDIDFTPRPFAPDAAWPIEHVEVSRWYEAAAAFFGCDPARFQVEATSYGDVRFDHLERWAPVVDMSVRHEAALKAADGPTLMLDATVIDLVLNDAKTRVDGLLVKGATGIRTLKAKRYVLACGGLETLRTLLVTQRRHPTLFGGEAGPLGVGYMGHISGKVADLQLADPASVTRHDFFIDNACYARRRFTLELQAQLREKVQNTAFWIDNAPFHDASHGSGVLSAVWLALASPLGKALVSPGVRLSHIGPAPHRLSKHVWNILGQPFRTLGTALQILKARYGKLRKPGFLIHNGTGRYALHYHAEHAPNAESRVRLAASEDANGTPRLNIDLRFADRDVESVLRTHEILDLALRQAGVGQLVYRRPPEGRGQSVWDQATDGFHQVGGARMAHSRETGVVDKNCRVFDLPNVYVASSCIFPSSGQANPTFLGVALALRLADHLALTRSADEGLA